LRDRFATSGTMPLPGALLFIPGLIDMAPGPRQRAAGVCDTSQWGRDDPLGRRPAQPPTSAAEQGAMRRVGVLEMAGPDQARLALWELFKQRLQELGHAEGDDIAFDFRWADGHHERLEQAATELVRLKVDVLVTAGTPAAAAAIRATADIPIVMATGVGIGTELGDDTRPRVDNVTGVSDLPSGLSAERLRLLREALPRPAPLGILANRANPSSPLAVRETQDAARAMDLEVRDYWVLGPDHFGPALAAMRTDGVAGFVVAPGATFFVQRQMLATLALAHRLLSMTARRDYAEAGCLMAYGPPIRENFRQAAGYVSRILGGARPADLPFDQPTAFEFVVNRKTADVLGLALPEALLARAEQIDR
jgi:putative ABC transport system substrate-binding protein